MRLPTETKFTIGVPTEREFVAAIGELAVRALDKRQAGQEFQGTVKVAKWLAWLISDTDGGSSTRMLERQFP
jgi:hypothetical protein